MRLLEVLPNGDFRLTRNSFDDEIPRYAILSHTWGHESEEVSHEDIVDGVDRAKFGYDKIKFCGEQARRDGLRYFWVDSCCIKKSSDSELSEAINSIFRWYQRAEKCYVYLSDVSTRKRKGRDEKPENTWEPAFRTSRWFTRGWTLQELLAPASVEFFSKEGSRLGDKQSLERQIHEITAIPIAALRGRPLSEFDADERISWAAKRLTKREEDMAYCLLGLFAIHIPIIYGEGRANAVRRLRQEIEEMDKWANDKREEKEPKPKLNHVHSLNHLDPQGEIPTKDNLATVYSRVYSLPLPDFRFRILTLDSGEFATKIVGHIQEVTFENTPPYHALSYVWGDEPAIHRIFINSTEVPIQPNLFNALQRIRLSQGQTHLWVDSLCINQADHVERNAQVRRMSAIYRHASSVFVWLGEEDSTSKFAMDFIRKLVQPQFQWDSLWWEQYGFSALARILERPWFRRGWVLQEAAFSTDTAIFCGDRQVHMGHFAMAINLVRARLNSIPRLSSLTGKTMSVELLANFNDSPAVRLLDTVERAFRKSEYGDILYHTMSLETLVESGTSSETTDRRDTIYTLLNLANDVAPIPESEESDGGIIPDYSKTELDVYTDFILHCCRHSESLDIICRPWAPASSPTMYPSWIATRDRLPFGDPSWRLKQRLYGIPLVGSSQKRTYNTHNGSKPHVSIGRSKDDGSCDGSLYAKGIILGEIGRVSTRMANAIVTKESLEILGTISRNPRSGLVNLPDAIWRTLCADRDNRREPAPSSYQLAMLHLLQISSEAPEADESYNLFEHMYSIDIEELLDTEQPDYVKKYLEVIRDVSWNRRTFRSKVNSAAESALVGLVPQRARMGDSLCILYGCSVPVVLRKLSNPNINSYWQLVGDAYIYGIIGGEALRYGSLTTPNCVETEFELR